MMEVFVSNNVIFGCSRPSNDGLNVLKVQSRTSTLARLKVVLLLDQTLETLGDDHLVGACP